MLPLLVDELEMQGVIASDEVGAAAALKMIRSVMIKGIEALTAECFLAAQRAGITDEVAASLTNNYPALDWPKVIAYNLERMASHGIRRADEMEQVAVTLAELGIAPLMTQATVARQRQMGELGKQDSVKAAKTEGADALLESSIALSKGPALIPCATTPPAGSGTARSARPWSSACRETSARPRPPSRGRDRTADPAASRPSD